MPHQFVPADTDPAVFALVVERWRSMTVAERALLADQLSGEVESIAIAAIRAERPDATDVEVRYELVRRRYGQALADEAYAALLPR